MKKLILAVFILGFTFNSYSQETEETEYKNVNSFDPQSLERFLKAFHSGKHAQDAKDALELLGLVQKIKTGKIAPDNVIPFENIGGANGWAGPGEMGFTGYLIQGSGGYITSAVFWEPFNGGKTPPPSLYLDFDGDGNTTTHAKRL